jgi:DNA end-binding protein Ku
LPRAMWSGAISFGLVNIPVKMYKATAAASGRSVSFHQIHEKCGTRIKMLRWCPKEDVEVPWAEVVKGYEVEKGKYVPVHGDELDALLPEDDYATVAIESFVALSEVDPVYYDRAYYLSPDGAGSPKAYSLLHRALADSSKVAVARVLLRTRSHLALVRVLDDHLIMETMFFASELTDAGDLPGVPKGKAQVEPKQLKMAEQLVASMTIDWQPERYKDEYAAKVKQVIEKKLKGGEVMESPARADEGGRVVNLLDALQRSVEATKMRGKKRAATLADVADLRPIPLRQSSTARSKRGAGRVSAVEHARKASPRGQAHGQARVVKRSSL